VHRKLDRCPLVEREVCLRGSEIRLQIARIDLVRIDGIFGGLTQIALRLGGQPKFETGRSAVRQVLFLLRVESNRLGSEVVPVGKWEGASW